MMVSWHVFLAALVVFTALYTVGAVWGLDAWVVVFFVLLAAILALLATVQIHSDVTRLPLMLSLIFGLSVSGLGAEFWEGIVLEVLTIAIVYLSSATVLRR